jgi:5S rRNA maturation endonuclease (ribonuclease M5)
MMDYGWWMDRLTPADTADGPDMYMCPVHGGGSFHVEERNGKALVNCFGCSASYQELVAAAEASGAPEDAEDSEDAIAAPSSTTSQGPVISFASGASGARVTQAVTPLDWCAQRCGMTREELDAMELPLSERGDRVLFEFGTARVKTRAIGEGKRKDITWEGNGGDPPMWPMPTAPCAGATDFVLCEGEFDAIALRCAGYDAFSITGGSTNTPDETAFRYMKELGWTRCNVLFDDDDAGKKGRDAVLESIRAAEIETATAKVAGINPLLGEKDARDVARRVGARNLELDYADEAVKTVPLIDVPSIVPEPLLLGYIHPREHTILYGDGSAGKGVVAAWWVAQLAAAGRTVLVVDYESHAEYEWRPRLEAMLAYLGCPGRMRDHVYLLTPGPKPIWEMQDWLRDQARRVGADFVVVDSVTYACIKDAEVSETAIRYSHAIARLKLPVLSIAHVTKADANPKHPFGSVYWSNGARVTIALSRTKPEDDAAPRLLKNWKSNQRSRFRDQSVDWRWVDKDGPPDHLDFSEVRLSQAQAIAQAEFELENELGRKPNGPEVAARATEIAGVDVKQNNVRQARARATGPKIVGKTRTAMAPKETE